MALPFGEEDEEEALLRDYELEVGDPSVDSRVAMDAPPGPRYDMTPEPERPQFGPLPEIPGVHPEVVRYASKFAADRSEPKPQGLSDAQKVEAAMKAAEEMAGRNRGFSMLQRAGAKAGAAFTDGKVDEKFFDDLDKQADRPILSEKEKIARAIAEAERIAKGEDRTYKREQAVATSRGAQAAAKAKLEEELRRRGEDRENKLGDEESKRKWEGGEHAKDRISRERAAKLGAGAKADESLNRDVEGLSKRMENVPAMKNDINTLTEYAKQDDIPGVGGYEARAPSWAPGISDEDVKVRQTVKGLVGAIMKEQSGTAASEGEVNRKLAELGMGPGATEPEFREGLKRLTENARGAMRAKEAGYRPAAVEEARRRGMATSADLPSGGGGLSPDKKARLEELRRKRDAGELR